MKSEPKMKTALAFIWTLLFYALVGPFVGLLGTLLFYQGIELFHAAWSNIELYWLHSLQCGPFDGGDCLHRIPQIIFLPSTLKPFTQLFSASGLRLLAAIYIFGFVPALFAGLLVALGKLIGENDFRLWHALVLGVVAAIIILAPISENRFHGATFAEGAACFIFICAFATTLCSLPVRLWWPRSINEANATARDA